MQILLGLFKVSLAQVKGDPSITASDMPLKDPEYIAEQDHTVRLIWDEVRSSNIVTVVRRGRSSREGKPEQGRKNYRPFIFICRRDVARACFHSTINLSRPGRWDWVQTTATMKEDIKTGVAIVQKADSVVHGGNNKVLPIISTSKIGGSQEQFGAPEKKEKLKVEKARAISRMKELLKWAAASKAEKGGKFISKKVLKFRNRGALKAVPDDDQLSNDSPKISFRWDLDSCSTASSFYSATSLTSSRIDLVANLSSADPSNSESGDRCCHPRKGNWITTDAEFVVLEL